MPRIPQYSSSGDYRPTDRGINAYDTMGRRIAGQYDAAASDIAQAGRVGAQMSTMIGRWPWNVLSLRQRLQSQADKAAAAAGGGGSAGGGAGGFRTQGGRGSITDAQFAPRRMPDLAALNQTSEGMGAIGRYASSLGGSSQDYQRYGYRPPGSQYGNLADLAERRGRDDAIYGAQKEAENKRQAQLDALAQQKSWDNYEKNLATYNADVLKNAQAASPYGTYDTGAAGYDSGQYNVDQPVMGGDGTPTPDAAGDYGGSADGWFSGWNTSGNAFAQPDNNGQDYSGTF